MIVAECDVFMYHVVGSTSTWPANQVHHCWVMWSY